MKLVSIIIPVYNVEKYLKKCLDSVLLQTYSNLEVILVDDGSTDSSGAICDAYALEDKRITVIHKENGGQATARNMALDICKGDYISFVDSDDSIKANMIEVMVNAIEANESDIAICGVIGDNGVYMREGRQDKRLANLTNEELMRSYVTTPNILTVIWNKVYKRFLFEDIRFPAFRAREDAYILHSVLGKCKKATCVGEHLYIQYIREGSTENSPFSESKLTSLDCAKSLMRYYKENYPALYELVAYRKIISTIEIMKEIISYGMLQKYGTLYGELFDSLRLDFEKAKNEYDPAASMDPLSLLAIKDNKKFIAKVKGEARRRNVKRYIKRFLKKVKYNSWRIRGENRSTDNFL